MPNLRSIDWKKDNSVVACQEVNYEDVSMVSGGDYDTYQYHSTLNNAQLFYKRQVEEVDGVQHSEWRELKPTASVQYSLLIGINKKMVLFQS